MTNKEFLDRCRARLERIGDLDKDTGVYAGLYYGDVSQLLDMVVYYQSLLGSPDDYAEKKNDEKPETD